MKTNREFLPGLRYLHEPKPVRMVVKRLFQMLGSIRWVAVLLALPILKLSAQERSFAELVGPGAVGNVSQAGPISVPFITWGGDMATFHANGGLSTKPGTIFARQGLNLRLSPRRRLRPTGPGLSRRQVPVPARHLPHGGTRQ